MANYVNSLTSVSSASFYHFPGQESVCLSLALVGVLCVAWGLALVFKSDAGMAPVALND